MYHEETLDAMRAEHNELVERYIELCSQNEHEAAEQSELSDLEARLSCALCGCVKLTGSQARRLKEVLNGGLLNVCECNNS
jgi:hypothetical protein